MTADDAWPVYDRMTAEPKYGYSEFDHDPPEYPEDTPVMVRYPLTPEQEQGPREAWPWLPATVTEVCGPDEWQVCVEADQVAAEDAGDKLYPLCFRDSSEIRPASEPETGAEAQA
jgi:hypothetical protein